MTIARLELVASAFRRKVEFLAAVSAVMLGTWVATLAQGTAPFPVNIRVDASKSTGPLKPIWRFFGADEPNYAYMKDGKKLIADQGRLAPKRVYFRAHSLLVTGDGTPALKWGSTNAYREDAQGNLQHNGDNKPESSLVPFLK